MAVSPLLGLLKNPLLEQIFVWQILQAVTTAILTPEIAGLQEEIFRLNPSLQLSVADAVDAVIKDHMSADAGRDEALLSGINPERFKILLATSGEPISLDMLLQAWRRDIIGKAGAGAESISLEQGIRESRVKNKWIPVIEKLQFHPIDPATAVEAWVRAQLPEKDARRALYVQGYDTAAQDTLYNVAGRPPGPSELIDLYRRGVIKRDGLGPHELTLQQGFYETDLKNKWWAPWTKLADYIPPPRTVTAMVREGALTDAQALQFFKDAGLSEALAAAYLAAAHHQKTASEKELAKGDLLQLYADKLIDAKQAAAMLAHLGYSAENAAFLLGYKDFQEAKRLLDQALSRLRGLYIAHKLDKPAALIALDALGVTPAGRDQLLLYWDLERAANVQVITAAEVADLYHYNVIGLDEALLRLQGLGFSADDAWLRLAARTHAALPVARPGPGGVAGA